MKVSVLFLGLLMVGSIAMATDSDSHSHGEIELKAGTSVTLAPHEFIRVTCEGADLSAPQCRVQRGSGCTSLFPMAIVDENGDNFLGRCYGDVDKALEILSKLKGVGQCR